MAAQDFEGDWQWIVIDDGDRPANCTMGQEHIRRKVKPNDPKHTVTVNLLEALAHVRGRKLIIIEDDDYYPPWYVSRMASLLDSYDAVGEQHARKYNLQHLRWIRHDNISHASLCATGVTRAAFGALEAACRPIDKPFLDMRFWRAWRGSRYLVDGDDLSIGIKGLPGRNGVDSGHIAWKSYSHDPRRKVLRTWLGPDVFEVYRDVMGWTEEDLMEDELVHERDREIERYRIAYQDPAYKMSARRLRGVLRTLLSDRKDEFESILDVGTGRGEMVEALKLCGWKRVMGTEVVPELLLEAGPEVTYAKITELPFAKDEFETVTCIDVIEHIPACDAEAAIKELGRVARRRMVLAIHNCAAHREGLGELHIHRQPFERWLHWLRDWLPGWNVSWRKDQDSGGSQTFEAIRI